MVQLTVPTVEAFLVETKTLRVFFRPITVKWGTRDACRLTFDELCNDVGQFYSLVVHIIDRLPWLWLPLSSTTSPF